MVNFGRFDSLEQLKKITLQEDDPVACINHFITTCTF